MDCLRCGVTKPEAPGVPVALAGKLRGLLAPEETAGLWPFVFDLLDADGREATAIFGGVRVLGFPTTEEVAAAKFLGLGLLKSDGRELIVLLGGAVIVSSEVFGMGNMPFSVVLGLDVLARGLRGVEVLSVEAIVAVALSCRRQ